MIGKINRLNVVLMISLPITTIASGFEASELTSTFKDGSQELGCDISAFVV
jgi:hypothetical protein